ncbi:Putative flagellin YvzB [Phycisphaerae bacterium RAS2]|nr:Putative flagellin YvzB [Phycisphaerae bacterium RAS2]
MGLTVTNSNTLSLLNILNKTSSAQSDTLAKLSTGYRVNKGSDDPAGLIAIQSLNSELVSVDAALSNSARAKSMLDVADGSLKEISSLLTQVQTLAAASVSSGGLSGAELAANQAQIDNAITAIDRIVRTSSFNGKNLLDGAQSIRATASDPTKVSDVRVYSRPSQDSTQSFAVNVTTAGTVASATLTTVSAASLGDAQFTVTGSLGTATITVADADTFAEIRDKIIAAASETGVSASISGSELHLQSRDYGSSKFVSASLISGDTDFANVSRTNGTNAVVTVNGQQAFVDGLKVSYNSNGTSGDFTLTTTGNVAGSAGNVNIDGGGATFQLGTSSNTRSTVGLNSLYSHDLGDSISGYLNTIKSGGANDLSTDANKALEIAKKAISQVATAQGRIGGFTKFQVESSVNSLNATKEGLTAARSTVRDIDFAVETAELSRQNVLLQSALSLLGVANQQSGQILSLLR